MSSSNGAGSLDAQNRSGASASRQNPAFGVGTKIRNGASGTESTGGRRLLRWARNDRVAARAGAAGSLPLRGGGADEAIPLAQAPGRNRTGVRWLGG